MMEQLVVADFVREGHFTRHIRKMRVLYAERQAALLAAHQEFLRGLIDLSASPAGMHLVGWLPQNVDDVIASRAAAAHSVDAPPLSAYSMKASLGPALVMGYTAIGVDEIRDGARRLGEALRSLR